jgi:hypothetical protein
LANSMPAKGLFADPVARLHCEQWQISAYLNSSGTSYETEAHRHWPVRVSDIGFEDVTVLYCET